jgi:Flp pilus assembly pilin Flp
MNGAVERIRKSWKKVDGQDIVEYALLLFLVALAAVASTKKLGATVKNVFANTNERLLFDGTLAGNAGTGDQVAVADISATANTTTGQQQAAAAVGQNENLATAYANDALDALAAGNLAASLDLGVAAIDQAAAAFDDNAASENNAAAGRFTAGNNDAVDAANANAAIAAAATEIANALAALNGNTTGGTVFPF